MAEGEGDREEMSSCPYCGPAKNCNHCLRAQDSLLLMPTEKLIEGLRSNNDPKKLYPFLAEALARLLFDNLASGIRKR